MMLGYKRFIKKLLSIYRPWHTSVVYGFEECMKFFSNSTTPCKGLSVSYRVKPTITTSNVGVIGSVGKGTQRSTSQITSAKIWPN